MRLRKAFSLAFILAGFVLPAICAAAAPVRRVNAHELVGIAAGACAETGQALAKRTGAQDSRFQPLRIVLNSMAGSLAEIGARLDARDLGFFKALRSGSRTLAEMHVLLERTGLQDPEIAGSIQSLDTAYGRLRNRYGQEWLRFRAGQQLSEAEKRRFEALRTMQALLVVKLQVLQGKAQAAGDTATAGELARLGAEARAIAEAPPSLEELLNASVAGDVIQGEYAALRDAHPVDEPEWNDADQVVTDLSTDESVGFVFTTDLDTVQQWSYANEPTDLAAPEDLESELEEETEPEMETEPEIAAALIDEDTECTAESAAEGCGSTEALTMAATPALPAPSAPASPAPAPAASRSPLHGFLL